MEKKKILIVEDNLHKLEKIKYFLSSEFQSITFDIAMSFTSGKKQSNEDDYDLVILDMSLPTYDKNVGESGGRFRTFGGDEIARKLIKRKENCKFIFLTQYKDFSGNTKTLNFDSLKKELSEKYIKNCKGFIYYNSTESSWKNELKELIIKNV
ncbi:MAG: response regulator [Marinomonas colpomeniae]